MKSIEHILQERILVLDGAMGSLLQRHALSEADFRGSCLEHHTCNTKGDFDLLSMSRPDLIEEIHRAYLKAGADIISTNTFNANRFSQAEYGTAHLVRSLNRVSAELAKKAASEFSTPEQPRFVAGSVGPTGKSASMSPDINDPAARSVSFIDLAEGYQEQIEGLIEGGADLILLETIFDTLNAKAAIFGLHNAFERLGKKIPVMISVTVSDASGRTLSGQTLEAFLVSIAHASPLSVGINCSLGAKEMYPLLKNLSRITPFFTSAHPNAGLPNEFGKYDESPESMALWVGKFLEEGLVNIIGGCCGTTPEHIQLIQSLAEKSRPRVIPENEKDLLISGLEVVSVNKNSNFVNIGERCNVAGSLKFARLIREEKFREALEVARDQAENGAGILDINLDDAMLDAKSSMEHFLRLLGSEPEVARLPFMIDASHWEVLETGMQNVQGKPIVNSISLKEGEEKFLEHARKIRRYGAALVVMAFDEEGQASSLDRRIGICQRAYRLLTGKAGFPPSDIIFDPNVLTICTGMKEHNGYALDFIESVRWIKENLPYAKVSGGISNLSFSFRGNTPLREAIHSVFLYHAIQAGLDMAIVNAGALPVYDELDPDLLERIEDAILNRRPDATERLLEIADQVKSQGQVTEEKKEDWRDLPLVERIGHALIKGLDAFIEADMKEALEVFPTALSIIEGPLMDAMGIVGSRFGEGKMFLPQVVKSARVMKLAVEVLEPVILTEKEKSGNTTQAKKIIMATVKGDVHDIGKNIVGVVLGCNHYEVVDLGVMVPADRIADMAVSEKADVIGLSGLITPSLDEMIHVVRTLSARGLSIPVIIGGATTSEIHTAVKIAPEVSFPVVHSKDASSNVGKVSALLSPNQREEFLSRLRQEQTRLREGWLDKQKKTDCLSLDQARKNKLRIDWDKERPVIPHFTGIQGLQKISVGTLRPYILWNAFFKAWQMPGQFPAIFNDLKKGDEAKALYKEANLFLDRLEEKNQAGARGVFAIFPANSSEEDILVYEDESRQKQKARFFGLREQIRTPSGEPSLCLADFLAPEKGPADYIGLFALASELENPDPRDPWQTLLTDTLSHRLAEAAAEWLHTEIRQTWWGYESAGSKSVKEILTGNYKGIRPAFGYPACPDHSEKVTLFSLLNAEEYGITLTENYAMNPPAAVSGMIFAHPKSRYFMLQCLSKEQIEYYAQRKQVSPEDLRKLLPSALIQK